MAPSVVGMDQRRRRAVLRVMEKMLDDESLDQGSFMGMHDAFKVKLWKATRCMSGQEFLLAVEERVLGESVQDRSRRACAYPGCTVVWGEVQDSADATRAASGSCCSSVCAEHVSEHATKLGSVNDASARFAGLYELAKRERDEKLRLAKGGVPAQGGVAGLPGKTETHSQNESRNSDTGNTTSSGNPSGRPKLAAGTSKTPIMHAVVKERPSSATSGSTQKKKEQVFDADAVEGYSLKKRDPKGAKEPRRVRFAPEEQLEQKREFLSHEPPAKVDRIEAKPPSALTSTPELTLGTMAREEQPPLSTAQFVFDIEDPKGPVDDDMKSIGDMFGTLNVVVPGEEGDEQTLNGDIPERMSEHGHTNGSTIVESNAAGSEQSVDAILARTLRDGAKHFPHLNIPDDVLQELEALDVELAEQDRATADKTEDADNSDSELDGFENIDSDFFSSDEDEDVPIRCQKTFFTQIYTFFDYWITDMSLQMISGDEGSRPSTQATTVPQVPEVVTAIQRFITIGSTTLATRLCVDANADAHVNKQVIADSIARLVGTFRLDAALPAFDSKQWLVVCLAMLKALGVHSHPQFQKLTETPAGAVRVGEILGDACFTNEELLAVVSLLLGEV